MRRRSEMYAAESSKYAHWIELYLSFHLNWVLGLFVHGRLQNLQTSEVTFAHVITPSIPTHASLHVIALVNGEQWLYPTGALLGEINRQKQIHFRSRSYKP